MARSDQRSTSLSQRVTQRRRTIEGGDLLQVVVIDQANQDFVSGWAFHESGVDRVDVFMDGRRVGTASYGLYRADVAERHLSGSGAAHTGFSYQVDARDLAFSTGAVVEIHVVCFASDGSTCSSFSVDVPTRRPASRYAANAPLEATRSEAPAVFSSPFPASVEEALRTLRGESAAEQVPWSPERVEEAVDDLILAHDVASKDSAGLFWYFSYLREVWTRLEFNARHFPALNRTMSIGRKDFYGIATSPTELFVICHHLAVLKSRGVRGSVCEFGCFKGFSTAILSEACARLGMTLNVFDSFQGLPESNSTFYREGEFKGSREELEANVREFGNPSSVVIHEGFFSESLAAFGEERIACLWMDVDLEVSARDAMAVFPRLDPKGCVFSDECAPEDFLSSEINEEPSPDRVIAPICDAFRKDDRAVSGSFVFGHTACFRDPGESLPFLPAEPLLRLRDGII